MSTKIHFRDYNPKQMILFPQRLDKDIADNDPVCEYWLENGRIM